MRPPREELARAPGSAFVCYDLECTGLGLHDELVQLAACAGPAGSFFSCYVLPPSRRVTPSAAVVTGLQLRGAGPDKALYDTRTGERLEAVQEEEALLKFLEWLRQVRGSHSGVVLVSHGAILLDIPVLLLALRRHGLTNSFQEVVSGFSDSNGVFRSDKSIVKYSLQELYVKFVGKRAESHRAEKDAQDLYTILLKYFKTTELSMDITALARYTYTTTCMLEYVAWLEEVEPHKRPLKKVLTYWNKRSPKLRNELVRNLLAAGHTYDSLQQLYARLGYTAFEAQLHCDVLAMKQELESYLTDTADLSASNVANIVATYFRRSMG